MQVSDIITRVRILSNDNNAGQYRTQDSDIILFTCDGVQYIGGIRPDSLTLSTTVTLAAGTKQSLTNFATPGQELLDVYRSGTQVVREIARNELDSTNPTWHGDTASATIQNYCYDERDPFTYWVYPPATLGASLDVLYDQAPIQFAVTNETTAIPLAQQYIDPLLNYVLSWVYFKESQDDHNHALAAQYRKNCDDFLKARNLADLMDSPEMNNPGGNVRKSAQLGGV